jgi:hypothetical protein
MQVSSGVFFSGLSLRHWVQKWLTDKNGSAARMMSGTILVFTVLGPTVYSSISRKLVVNFQVSRSDRCSGLTLHEVD